MVFHFKIICFNYWIFQVDDATINGASLPNLVLVVKTFLLKRQQNLFRVWYKPLRIYTGVLLNHHTKINLQPVIIYSKPSEKTIEFSTIKPLDLRTHSV